MLESDSCRCRFGVAPIDREAHHHDEPRSISVSEFDVRIVQGRDMRGYGKSEACPVLICLVQAEEALKHSFSMLTWYSRPGIGNLEFDSITMIRD